MNAPPSMTARGQLLICPHLGLGDALVSNAIVRKLAREHDSVVVLCKPHNAPSEAFMWKDVINLEVFSVADDDEARKAIASAREAGFGVFGLGCWGEPPFDARIWDREFYRQAGMDFQLRWNEFVAVRQPARELRAPREPYCLLHEDRERGFTIDRARLPALPVIEIVPVAAGNLFDYWELMESATELHFIDSAPVILADSLPLLRARRKAVHDYARKGIRPSYQGDWEILA